MKFSKKEISTVLAQVEAELDQVLKSERNAVNKLSKAAEGDEEGSASAGGPPPGGSEGSAGGEASAGGPPPGDASGAPPAGPGDAAGGPPPGGPGAGEPGMDAGPVDPAALQAEYAKLPPEELQMHFEACKAALEQVMGGGAGAGGPPPGPPPGPGAGGPPPMGKREMPSHATNGDVEKKLGKMEASLAEATQHIELLSKALELTLGRPQRKAVTGNDFVPAKGAVDVSRLSKSEITSKLAEKTRDPSLKKSDRELVNKYYGGAISVDGIKHLLG